MNGQELSIRLSLVIPCYNESERISLLYAALGAFMKEWKGFLEVIIINDGSRDNTFELLQQHPVYLKHKENIAVYTQENTGKGGALRNGVLRATGDFILTLDADMATAPSDLFNWFSILNWAPSTNTIYIGSREHKDSVIRKVTDERKMAGNIFNTIIRMLTPIRAHDTQCGFKLYPSALGKKYFGELKTYGWAHDVEILYNAHLHGNIIREMPVTWTAIEGSKIRVFKDGMNMLLEVLRIVRKTKKAYRRR